MDKKSKKRVVVLRQRLLKLQKILASVKLQCDDPQEVVDVQAEIAKTEHEISELMAKQ